MAHLNVRQRRIEATIAFVGRADGARAQLDLLQASGDARPATTVDVDGVSARSLSWSPAWSGVAGLEGAVTLRALDSHSDDDGARLARAADGVVLVVDDARAHLAEHLAARDALAQALSGSETPVVVQLAPGGTDDLVPMAELVDTLGLQAWPLAGARDEPRRAVELALDAVALALMTPPEVASESDETPLLDSLRSTIDAALRATTAELERRWLEAVRATSREAVAETSTRLDALQPTLGRLDERLASLSSEVTALSLHLRELQASLVTTAEAVTRAAAEGRASAKVTDATLAKLRESLDAEAVLVRRAGTEAEDAKAAATRAAARMDALERVLARAVDAGAARAERAAAAAQEPLTQLGGRVGELVEASRAADARAAALERATRAASEPATRTLAQVTELPTTLSRLDAHADARSARVEALIQERSEHANARVEAVGQSVDALLDELRTKKKGWFG